MTVSDLLTPASATAGYSPAPVISTNGETFQATVDFMRTNMNSDSALRLNNEAYRGRDDLIRKRFGQDPMKISKAREKYPSRDPEAINTMLNYHQQEIDRFITEGRKNDPQKFDGLKTSAEVQDVAREKARMSKRQFEDIVSRNPSPMRGLTTLAGGIAGGFTDPLNIATLPFGAGASRSILKAALIEGSLNAAVETATLPAVSAWQKELGHKYGVGEMAADVGTAFVGGAALSTIIKGAMPVFRKTSELAGSVSRHVLDKIAASERLPGSVRDAAAYMSRVAHIDESVPPGRVADDIDLAAHREIVAKTADDFEQYREPTAIETDPEIVSKTPDAPAEDDVPSGSDIEIPSDIISKGDFRGLTPEEAAEVQTLRKNQEQKNIIDLKQGDTFMSPGGPFPAGLHRITKKTESRITVERVADGKTMTVGPKKATVKATVMPKRVLDLNDTAKKRLAVIDQPKKAGVKGSGKNTTTPARAEAGVETREAISDMDDMASSEKVRPLTRMPENVTIKDMDRLASKQATFDQILKEDPDMKIVMEDGTVKTLKQINDEVQGDLAVIEALTTCRIA